MTSTRAGADGPRDSRDSVYETFRDEHLPLDDRIEQALTIGSDHLGTDVGFVTAIDEGTQRITHVSGDAATITVGASCPLDEAYCRRTVETAGLLSVQDAAESSDVADAAVERFDLGAYIGSKVLVRGETVGTVCFADAEARTSPFTDEDELFVEMLARRVGQAFERDGYEGEIERRNRRLVAERDRFADIAADSFDVIFRLDENGEFTFVSAALERVLGYTPEEVVGDPYEAYLTEAARYDAERTFQRLRRGDTVEQAAFDYVHADGSTVTLEVNATPVEREDGTVTGIQGVARDVTARRKREAELRLKTRAMDDADVGITIADVTKDDEPLIYVNEAFEEVTGYDASEVIGRNCRFLQGPDTDEERARELRAAIADRESVTVELLNYRRDGRPFWNQVALNPVSNGRGETTHFVGFQEDVTERMRVQQLLALLNRVLRHNLRNGVNVLMVDADRLTRPEITDGDEVAARFQRTASSLAGLGDKARQLEQYARTERDPRRIEPAALLEAVCSTHADGTDGVEIRTRIETDLDLCVGPEIDAALDELVANAVSHDPSDRTTVDVEVIGDGGHLTLSVTDDGPGIPETEARVIQRGEETALEHGNGLGLWLVNWIVTRYGGSFQIRPLGEDGDEGTEARLTLPGVGADENVDAAARPPVPLFY